MTRSSLLLLTILLNLASVVLVNACEEACRGDPVTYLSKRYAAVLDYQAKKIADPEISHLAKKQIPRIVSRIDGRDRIIDKTIFDKFAGPCEHLPGLRNPEEFCGSAKSIACFAPWDHRDSVFQMVHKAVMTAVKDVYGPLSKRHQDIKEEMIEGVAEFCPHNCQDWVEPFQHIMLVWEQREHAHKYRVTPNCLPLGTGGF
ncbi:hypothetical protein BGX28_005380 [Mortierella sp. GBA30]|nr:hypothetical protein BGX28_005380 [Mortierella sp. GBA30]